MHLNRRIFLGALLAGPLVASPAFAVGSAVFITDGLAIGGYDPVAYFREGAPMAGQQKFRLMWRNAIWQFESRANMEGFERNPHAFAPQYGGYCAMSLTQGQISPSMPDAWAIHGGRLYFTHSRAALQRWQSEPATFIQQADRAWPAALCDGTKW